MKALEDFVYSVDKFVVAHRGSSGTAPENTLASVNEAVRAGAHMIEIDIQFSADNKIIVFHDENLERTSNGAGSASDKTYHELSELDAGAWFDKVFTGEKIPLLQNILDLIKGKCYLNIEIKSRAGALPDKKLSLVLNTIKDFGFKDFTLFSSFDHQSLKNIRDFDPEFHTSAINIPGDTRLPSEICNQYGSEGFVCSLSEINQRISLDTKENGIFVGVYSVDSEKHLEMISDYNIKALVTNYPARIINLLEKDNG